MLDRQLLAVGKKIARSAAAVMVTKIIASSGDFWKKSRWTKMRPVNSYTKPIVTVNASSSSRSTRIKMIKISTVQSNTSLNVRATKTSTIPWSLMRLHSVCRLMTLVN